MPGKDPSWTYAINYFFAKGVIFGRDVVWTYGPLGFLSYPQFVGANIEIATAFQLFLWLVFLVFLAYHTLRADFPLIRFFFFTVLYMVGHAAYSFGLVGFDQVLDFYAALLLCLAFTREKWLIPYVLAALLAALSLLIKASSFFFIAASIFGFIVVKAFYERRKALCALALSLLVPVFFVCFYFLYCPSLSAIIGYLRGISELSAGYNIARSLPGKPLEMALALSGFVLYFLFMIILYKTSLKAFLLSLMFVPALFVAFKHGFVRPGTHTLIFLSSLCSLVALLIFFADELKMIWRAAFLVSAYVFIFVFLFPLNLPPHMFLNGVIGRFAMNSMVRFSIYRQDHERLSQENLRTQVLSQEVMKRLEGSKIGIFPWEVSYAAANPIAYVPFPVMQADDAYTPYLDRLNAGFLEDSTKAPDRILFEWKAVDGRNPLADVPSMTLALYKWYDADLRQGDLLIVKRRQHPRFSGLALLEKGTFNTQDEVTFPPGAAVARIHMHLNKAGLLSKVLYKVPAVRMALLGDSGQVVDFRVVPETLENGLFAGTLPIGLDDAEMLFGSGEMKKRFRGFRLGGEGLPLYDKEISVEFYRIR
jgi:hypothetical protein